MVVIRLSRGGAKKAPFYHIVAADRREARDGRFIERLGHFNPKARGKETRLELNKERVEHWINKGAQPSERVSHLLKAFTKDAAAAAKGAPTVAETKKAQQKASATAAKKKIEPTPKEEPSSEPRQNGAGNAKGASQEPKPEENK